MTEKEILLAAIDIIGQYSNVVGDDNPSGYKVVSTYQSLIDEINNFMNEVGYNNEDAVD